MIFSCYFSPNKMTYEFEQGLADLETCVFKYAGRPTLVLDDFNIIPLLLME